MPKVIKTPLSQFLKFKQKEIAGTQDKWEKDGIYYKTDTTPETAEGLAECIASDILSKSNIKDFCHYDPQLFKRGLKTITGCSSENFIPNGYELLTSNELVEILGLKLGAGDTMVRERPELVKEYVEGIQQIKGLEQFDKYLAAIYRFDAIVCNIDRNLGNIIVFRSTDHPDEYKLGTVFDNGRSFGLFYDEKWDKGYSVEDIIEKAQGQPFYNSLERQAQVAEEIAGGPQFYTTYSVEDLQKSLSRCSEYYPEKLLNRVRSVVFYQMEKYPEFFRNEKSKKLLEDIEKEIGKVKGFSSQIEDGVIKYRCLSCPEQELDVTAKRDIIYKIDGKVVSLENMREHDVRMFHTAWRMSDLISGREPIIKPEDIPYKTEITQLTHENEAGLNEENEKTPELDGQERS